MRNRWPILLVACAALCSSARAAELSFDGYADVRLVLPSNQKSWIDGGLGKFRFGARQPSPNFRFTEAVEQVGLDIAPDIRGVVLARAEPEQRTAIDLLESYLAWRPAAAERWRWSITAGAFFPPISLENDDIGWTSSHTLTPSAVNSWVGDELRTIGGEATLEWRGTAGTLRAVGALFCCNEPAGILLAKRGWSLDDRPTGLFERVNTPAAKSYLIRPIGAVAARFPQRRGLFEQIDGRVGWYGGFNWSMPDLGEAGILYYDNDADPAAFSTRDTAWRTHFLECLLSRTVVRRDDSGSGYHGPDRGRRSSAERDLFRFRLCACELRSWRLASFRARGNVRDPKSAHHSGRGRPRLHLVGLLECAKLAEADERTRRSLQPPRRACL